MYNELKEKMLNRALPFSIFLFLDSNGYDDRYGKYDCLLAVGVHELIEPDKGDGLALLLQQHDATKDWLFGHITYDYKSRLEPRCTSHHPANLKWPDLSFFRPEIVCHINRDRTLLTIESLGQDPDEFYKELNETVIVPQIPLPHIEFTPRTDKEKYLNTIAAVRQHIKDGDCYEINICCEGYAANKVIEPLSVYNALRELSPAPFAAFYRNEDRYMMCAGPERYVVKKGNKIISQPIKGTARRDKDLLHDEQIKNDLFNSIKDRAENVMIADLVRNDLARTCVPGSVNADELFGIYSFPQVHQMVSTISGTLSRDKSFTDVLRYSFPMGSMTGAPKVKVMELIERYESARRELYSGTVGYITPAGDFDFNVVIRSLFYNSTDNYLSYQTGGAITYDSIAESEWEEMRLKAWALERIFNTGA